eukprot:TRINITY_DN10972_c0_g1_i1.p1 TRINITY_DN10972_c0_g1~~TRINITY_DN10972_c0_g1_i1.p1  ORF type:complete len:471 (+),score=67.46 TRINITY_DN10972_c0_g1_i1:281-1693(+)
MRDHQTPHIDPLYPPTSCRSPLSMSDTSYFQEVFRRALNAIPRAHPFPSLLPSLTPTHSTSVNSSVFGVEYKPDGSAFVCVGEDAEIHVVDERQTAATSSGAPIPKHSMCASLSGGHTSHVNIAKFMDNNRMVTASDDRSLCLWDLRTMKPVKSFRGHDGWVKNCEVYDDNHILSGSLDGSVRLWDLREDYTDLERGTEWPWNLDDMRESDENKEEEHDTHDAAGFENIVLSRPLVRMRYAQHDRTMAITLEDGDVMLVRDFVPSRNCPRLDHVETYLDFLLDDVHQVPETRDLRTPAGETTNRIEILGQDPINEYYATALSFSKDANFLLVRRLESLEMYDLRTPEGTEEGDRLDRLVMNVPDASSGEGFIKAPCFGGMHQEFCLSPYHHGLRTFCISDLIAESKVHTHTIGMPDVEQEQHRWSKKRRKPVAFFIKHDKPVLVVNHHPWNFTFTSAGLDGRIISYGPRL